MENSETTKLSTESLIKNKFHETFTILKVLSDSVEKDQELLRTLHAQAIAKKQNNPEITFEGIRDEILKTHETTTFIGLKEQDIQKNIARLMLLSEMAAIAGIDLKMTEEDQVNFDYLLNNTKSLFAIDVVSKELKIADTEIYRSIFENYVTKVMTDTRLEEIFNSPYFTPKK
jgi:hypothetical protein